MTNPWLLTFWGINLIRSLSTRVGGVKFTMVVVDYFTKWVEAEPLKSITVENMVKFYYKNIICQYDIPYKIVSNNGL